MSKAQFLDNFAGAQIKAILDHHHAARYLKVSRIVPNCAHART
jgi:hypothetical protein